MGTDAEQSRVVQRALRVVALGGSLTLLGFQAIAWHIPAQFQMLSTDYLALCACLIALALDIAALHRLAAGVLVLGGWVAVTVAVVSDGGLYSVSTAGFLPVLALTVLVGSLRGVVVALTGFVLVILGIMGAQYGGLIPEVPRADAVTSTVRLCGCVTILGAILWWGLSRIERLQQQAAEDSRRVLARSARVQRQRELIDEVVAGMPGALWVSDVGLQRTTWLSPYWEAILGRTPSTGTSVAALLGLAELPGGSIRISGPDGAPRWLRQHVAALSDDKVIGLVVDETAHRQREAVLAQRAVQAERARSLESIGRLAGVVAHDANNVLMIAQSVAMVAASQLSPSHPARPDLDEISACSARGGQRMMQLMAFARRHGDSVEQIDVGEVVRRAEGLLRLLLPETIQLSVTIAEPVRSVMGAPGLLEQALVNLIDATAAHTDRIALCVADRGAGVALSVSPVVSEELADLLAPFLSSCVAPTRVESTPDAIHLLLSVA
jgi:signal transduction histidine kinase